MVGRLLQKVASASGISRSSFLLARSRCASAPIISNCLKPSKQTFSSQTRTAKFYAELAEMDAQTDRFWKTQMWLWSFSSISCLVGILCELELEHIRNMKNQSISPSVFENH